MDSSDEVSFGQRTHCWRRVIRQQRIAHPAQRRKTGKLPITAAHRQGGRDLVILLVRNEPISLHHRRATIACLCNLRRSFHDPRHSSRRREYG